MLNDLLSFTYVIHVFKYISVDAGAVILALWEPMLLYFCMPVHILPTFPARFTPVLVRCYLCRFSGGVVPVTPLVNY